MNKDQKELFDRAVEFGFDKPEARFHVLFHETALRKLLDSRSKKGLVRWEPSPEEMAEAEKDLDRVIKTIEVKEE